MQVTQTNSEGLKQQFKVVISAAQIDEKVTDRLGEVGRTARIPGFRPGKVPMAILRKKFLSGVMSEVLEGVVNDGTQHAIETNKLRPALQPKVEVTSFEQGGDLEFTVSVEVLPEVEIADLSALTLEKPVSPVDEAEVTKALEDIAGRSDKTEKAPDETLADDGDVVVINFLGRVDGVAFEGGTAEDYALKLGSNTFIPGFEAQLIGAKAGDERLVKVAFPAEYGAEHLAGKDAEFEVKINEVRQVVPTPIDDELAKLVGLADLEALKTALREEIGREYAGLSRMHLKRALLDQLAATHSFAVPEGMVNLEFDAIWKQLEQDKAAGRLDPSDEGKSDDELKAEYRGIAERRVRLGLVLSEIGSKNKVTITQEDLNRAVLNEARRFPGQEQLVFQYFQKNQEALNGLRAPIFEDKVVDYILELATVTEKAVSIEDLRKDPDAHPDEAAVTEDKPKKKAAAKKKSASTEE